MIAGGVERELGFIFKGAESAAVNNAFAVPLKFGAKIVGGFGMFAAEAFTVFAGKAAEKRGLLFFPFGAGADRHPSGMDGRGGESRDGKNSCTKDVNIGWIGADKLEGETATKRRRERSPGEHRERTPRRD